MTPESATPESYIAAARSSKQSGRLDEALEILSRGITRCAPSPELYEYYIERLEKCNRTEEAIGMAREATRLFPEALIFVVREALLLPIFYDTSAQIEHYRGRFTEGLHRIIHDVALDTPENCRRALDAAGRNVNKYLPYQGQNDCQLQSLYGSWLERIMALNYPHLAQSLTTPLADGKIRVGYLSALSARFLNMSAAKLFGGWIREQDRRQFEIFAYHADRHADPGNEYVERWSVRFRQLPGEVEEIAKAIRADRLHVLIYLDFGMHPRMAQLAALRLAPAQCVVWDTPLTSGIPAMDYFLSSDFMEPEDGHTHYSETLVRLPGVGVSFPKPVIPTVILQRTRADFGLREDGVVYLCCQSIFKYLPAQDELIAQIAGRVPHAQFVFLVTNEVAERDFRKRVERAFDRAGLRAAEFCVWLPEMRMLDFWNLHLLADVSLDTVGWSGGVTAFESIACNLPIVTLPGRLMRSRHSYAILKQLGVTQTIARDAAEYVEIAVRLGMDREWRQAVVDGAVAGYRDLYSDTTSVRSLEEFLHHAVKERTPCRSR